MTPVVTTVAAVTTVTAITTSASVSGVFARYLSSQFHTQSTLRFQIAGRDYSAHGKRSLTLYKATGGLSTKSFYADINISVFETENQVVPD